MERINRWLGRLTIAHKLILSGVFFTLPIGILLYFVTGEYNREIRTSEKEVAGTASLEVCPALLRDLRALESLENLASHGAELPQSNPLEITRRVGDAVAALQLSDGTATRELTTRLSGLWRQLQDRGQAMSHTERATVYQLMVRTTSQLVPAILDDSCLTLDSQLRTYHLTNATGPLLLQAQTAIAEARAVAMKAKTEGRSLDQRDLAQLHAQSATLLNAILPGMRHSLETALREDKLRQGADSSFQRIVPPLFERYAGMASDLFLQIDRSAVEQKPGLTPDRIAVMAAAAEDAGVSFGTTGVKELRNLLISRIAEAKRSRSKAWLLSLACLALAAAVMVAVTLNIKRPLNVLVNATTDIAGGRVREAFNRQQRKEFRKFLSHNADGNLAATRDEVYKLIRSVFSMTESLNTLLDKVGQAANHVAGSAARMSAAVRQVEAAVTEQAASTSQVGAASKQINATAQDLARTMADVTRMADEAAETARGGVSSLEGIRSAIDELIHASASMAQTFSAINEKTSNIDKVITTITKVANRTNLLSLNAAIEAEKEGEKAAGFTVVAVEMRRLADQTAVAALDIEKQIRDVQHAVLEGVSSVEAYAGQTQAKSTAVTELSSELGQVIEGTTRLAPQFEALNGGMQMQSQSAGQIAESMVQLRDSANQTRDSLAEFRQVAEDLQSAVRDLQAEVGRFAAS